MMNGFLKGAADPYMWETIGSATALFGFLISVFLVGAGIIWAAPKAREWMKGRKG
jgi:hypothetical protein